MPQRLRPARTIMIQGTGSHVGKSVLATALCRILRQDGYDVAPFKSQNMSNNSCVTFEGGEIGRAQWVQAEAAGVAPSVKMNPVLIKPKADSVAQVVLMGRPAGDFAAGEYRSRFTASALPTIRQCLDDLRSTYDAVVIEGAGSPAEVNLKQGEIVNMRIAKLAESPVLLVADIDRGGVFASLVGTLELLDPDERAMVAGFIINKFRGDKSLLVPGLDFLEKRTGRPVLGVVPHLPSHSIPDEDAVSVEASRNAEVPRSRHPERVRIAILHFPRISNFDDFDRFSVEPGVDMYYASEQGQLAAADCIILPGTKNTVADLEWLKQRALYDEILSFAGRVPVIGLCGGFQMLGKRLHDPEGSEGPPGVYRGLGLLDVDTLFGKDKTTTWSRGTLASTCSWLPAIGTDLVGYEIHAGVTYRGDGVKPLICVHQRDGKQSVLADPTDSDDGAIDAAGEVLGTYFHALFENDAVFDALITELWRRKGVVPAQRRQRTEGGLARRLAAYDALSHVVRQNVDIQSVYRIMGLV